MWLVARALLSFQRSASGRYLPIALLDDAWLGRDRFAPLNHTVDQVRL